MKKSAKAIVECYLRTGKSGDDPFWHAWPGEDLLARAKRGDATLRDSLISTVKTRTAHAATPKELIGLDVATFARKKVEPMVRGLFPAIEQEPVLDVLSRSLIFLTPDTIGTVLRETPYLETSWKLANLYLASCGVERLSEDAPSILGLSEGTTCYVTMAHFRAQERFDDFVVHEAAHLFHNCKRKTIGLRETRWREWPLDIAYAKRETFAYACEVYSRILELGNNPKARRTLLTELEQTWTPPDERVDADEFIDILREAVDARNGWKRILKRCAPPKRKTTADETFSHMA
jgi:hypothetical protein